MMQKRFPIGLRMCFVVVSFFSLAAQAGDIAYVAGTAPSQRPASYPIITQVQKNDAWLAEAMHGVDRPYPPSLKFIEDQGNWFTPFTHPGMTGPYDIRGWHTR